MSRDKLNEFMHELGRSVTSSGTVYLTGGATALLLGLREATVDIDIKPDPEPGGFFEAIARLKESLQVNVKLAAPDQFIPALPGWRERSAVIAIEGRIEFRQYDLYSQALAKVERGLAIDQADARAYADRGLVNLTELQALFEAIRPQLGRYPAIDPVTFQADLEQYIRTVRRD